MNRRSILATIAASLLLISGCGGGEGPGTDSDPPEGSNASTPTPDAEATAADQTSLKFGDPYTFEDGLSVTVGKPKPFKPSPASSLEKVNKWKNYVVFEVVVVNGTKKRFDPSAWLTTLQSKDGEGEEVFDEGVETPQTNLLAGRQTKFKVAYGVLDPSDLVMDVDVDGGNQYATLTYSTTE